MFFLSFSFFLKKINLELHHRLKHSPNCYVLLLPVNDNNFFGKQVQQQLSLDRGLLNTGLFAIQSEKIMFLLFFFVKLLFFLFLRVNSTFTHGKQKSTKKKKSLTKLAIAWWWMGAPLLVMCHVRPEKLYILFSKILRILDSNSTHHYIVSIYRSKTEKKVVKMRFSHGGFGFNVYTVLTVIFSLKVWEKKWKIWSQRTTSY